MLGALGLEPADETIYRALLRPALRRRAAHGRAFGMSEPDVAKALARLQDCGLVNQ